MFPSPRRYHLTAICPRDTYGSHLDGVKIDGFFYVSKFYVDSKNVREKFLHRHSSVMKNHPLPPKGRFFSSFGAYIFGIYIKFGYKNPSILTPSDSVNVAT
jgi:hypothetical protein